MKRLFLFVLMLLVILIVGIWLALPLVVQRARPRLEAILSAQLGEPVSVGSLNVRLVPLRLGVRDVMVGAPAWGAVDALILGLDASASLTQAMPVLRATVEGPLVDLTMLPKKVASFPDDPPPSASGTIKLPRLRIADLSVRDAVLRFHIDAHATAELSVHTVQSQADLSVNGDLVHGEVMIDGVRLSRPSHYVEGYKLHARGGWGPGGLYLETARLEGKGVFVEGQSGSDRYRFEAHGSFEPRTLAVVVPELGYLEGYADLSGVLAGSIADPFVEARLRLRDAAFAHREIGSLDAEFRRQGPLLDFSRIRIEGPAGRAVGHCDISVGKEVPINADLDWDSVDVSGIIEMTGGNLPLSVAASGHTTLSGYFDPLSLFVVGRGTLLAANVTDAQPLADWASQVHIHKHDVAVVAQVWQGDVNRAAANLHVGDNLDGTITLAANDLGRLDPLLIPAVHDLALTGHGELSVDLAGTSHDPNLTLRVDAQEVTIRGARVPRLHGEAKILSGVLHANNVRVDSARGYAAVDGRLALNAEEKNDWRLTLSGFDADVARSFAKAALGVDPPLSGGALDGSVLGTGEWRRFSAQGDVNLQRFRVGIQPFAAARLNGRVEWPRWEGTLNLEHAAGESLAVRGKGTGDVADTLHVEMSPVDLASFSGAGRERLSGIVTLSGDLSGRVVELSGAIEGRVTGLMWRDRSIGPVTLITRANRGKWSSELAAPLQRVSLNIELQGRPPFDIQVTGEWNETDAAAFLSTDPTTYMLSSGQLALSGPLADIQSLSGSAEITSLRAGRGTYEIKTANPARLRLQRGRVEIESFDILGGGSKVSGAGWIDLAGNADLSVQGAGDLGLLDLLGPPIEAARGPFEVEITIKRQQGASWNLAGFASLREGSLDAGLPIAFTKIDGRIRLEGSRIIVEELGGRAGGGTFRVDGHVSLVDGPDLTMGMKDVSLNLARGLEARVRGEGSLRGSWEAMFLEASVEVVNSLYDRDIELGDLWDLIRDQLTPKGRRGPAEVSPLTLKVTLYSQGGVYIDNNIAKGEMWLNLFASGNAAQPRIWGTVGVLDGEIVLRGRTFTVTSGSMDFRDTEILDPSINLAADSRITTTDSDYIVSMLVSGTVSKPRIQFSSDDPGLSQNDVVSLVAFGKTGSQLQREQRQFNPSDALVLLPTGEVEKRVSSVFGLDRFEVGAGQSQDARSIEPRVTVGKNLTRNLSVLGSSTFGVDPRRTVRLEYRLTRRVSFFSSWESETQANAGAFGGGITFRIDAQRLPFTLTPCATGAKDTTYEWRLR